MIDRRLLGDPNCRARVDALIGQIDAAEVVVCSDATLDAAIREMPERTQLERGGLEGRHGPKDMVALVGDRGGEVFAGYTWNELRNGRRERVDNGVLCHTGIELQSAVGCTFDCTYCPYTRFICARVDIEHFAEQCVTLARRRRGQRLYKLNNRSDTLGLEPQLGLAAQLIEGFARLDDAQLMLYSKGDAVEHLTGCDHRGHTVASFTLTPAAVANWIETGAPTPARRLAAIRRLFVAGFPIRVRFSPIVPVVGWREAYAELVAALAAVAEPEMVTLWTLSMIDFEHLARIVPPTRLEPDIAEAARAASHSMRGRKGAPFPPAARTKIYKELACIVRDYLPKTAVALCLETPDVWQALEGQLTRGSRHGFLCNCAPQATSERLVALGRRQR